MHLISALHALCPTHPTLFDLIILIMFGEQKQLMKLLTLHFLQSNVTVFWSKFIPIAHFHCVGILQPSSRALIFGCRVSG